MRAFKMRMKNSERHDDERHAQYQKHRPHKGVDDPQHERHDQQRTQPFRLHARQPHGQRYGDRGADPANQNSFMGKA